MSDEEERAILKPNFAEMTSMLEYQEFVRYEKG